MLPTQKNVLHDWTENSNTLHMLHISQRERMAVTPNRIISDMNTQKTAQCDRMDPKRILLIQKMFFFSQVLNFDLYSFFFFGNFYSST